MNELVDAVNEKIAEAVKKAGDQVVFVDYDLGIRTSGGQFCEKGVDEPNPSRYVGLTQRTLLPTARSD